MMTCEDWKAFVHDYVLGDLSDPAREVLDLHAGSCPSCLGEARALKLVDRTLKLEPAVEPPPDLGRRALESIAERPRREYWRIAAALLLAGVLGAASATGAVSRRLPEEVRSAPRVIADAAGFVPHFLIKE